MTNFRCSVGVLGVQWHLLSFLSSFFCYMAFWPTCLYFATYILEFKIGFDHGLQLVNDVSVFNGILAHFLSIFYLFFGLFFCCSFVFLAIWGIIKPIFAYSFQFTGKSYWNNNHISSILISPKYSKCQFRHFACLYIFIYLCFSPTSLVPVEGIITVIKTDNDLDPEWSPFGSHVLLDIRYMTNDSNIGVM